MVQNWNLNDMKNSVYKYAGRYGMKFHMRGIQRCGMLRAGIRDWTDGNCFYWDGVISNGTRRARQRSVPPHLCFNLGSMGFLTPFEYDFMREEVGGQTFCDTTITFLTKLYMYGSFSNDSAPVHLPSVDRPAAKVA